MPSQAEKASLFLSLHHGTTPLLLPNPWDAGAAKVLQSVGFAALATTSGGFAATLGRRDGAVSREEALAHAAAIVAAVDVPVSADLENGFDHGPTGVAETVTGALAAGLAGCSIEDFAPGREDAIYPLEAAVDRVAAAAAVAHGGGEGDAVRLVLTARAENYLHGRPDLADTIARLQAYQEAGADVLYAPGLIDAGDIKAVVSSVDRPVNVLARPGVPPVKELGALGVARVSVGSAFAWVAINAVLDAARELQERGTYGFLSGAATGSAVARSSFEPG